MSSTVHSPFGLFTMFCLIQKAIASILQHRSIPYEIRVHCQIVHGVATKPFSRFSAMPDFQSALDRLSTRQTDRTCSHKLACLLIAFHTADFIAYSVYASNGSYVCLPLPDMTAHGRSPIVAVIPCIMLMLHLCVQTMSTLFCVVSK